MDFVVVLGSGLTGGSRVPPLLASRLERARAIYQRQAAGGHPPTVITSGGQGRGERLPEARAMADYLIRHGIPGDRIQCEDRSAKAVNFGVCLLLGVFGLAVAR